MALTLDNIEFKTELPKIPDSISLYNLKSPSLEEREPAIKLFIEILKLGKVNTIELKDSIMFASKRGEVEFFPASGSIWARDALAGEKTENEERKWDGLEKKNIQGETHYVLNTNAAERLSKQAYELLDKSKLLNENAVFDRVELDQYVQFDEKGQEINSGAGSATIKFLYAVDTIPVFGPGAKTYIYADPEDGKPRITGAFHAWRELLNSKKIELPATEESLASGFLKDPELMLYHKRGQKVEVSRLDFGYYSMPAFSKQSYLFPVFEVEGSIIHPNEESRSYFLKHHHAIPPKLYKKVNARAYYLMNQL